MATEIGTHFERDDLGGGRFHLTQHMRSIAYQPASGALRRIVSTWGDGDASYPQMVSDARLRVRTAPNGDRRILPIPGDDDAWFSISSPYIKPAGSWIQPNLGAFSRQGNLLTAENANVKTYIWHAGHYIKAGFLLKGGWLPPNGQFAFRVGLNGMIRQGGNLIYNGESVMQLRAPVAYDWDNPADVRAIPYEFVQLNGNWYILFSLPSLAGMSKPVIDPTINLQPDGTDGTDIEIVDLNPDTVFNSGLFSVGKSDTVPFGVYRILIRFSLAAVPTSAIIGTASLSLFCLADFSSNSRSFRVYRQLRSWVETQATWNSYSTGNAWQTAGGFGVLDCEQTAIGSRDFTATETLNEFKVFPLTSTSKATLDNGNGWMVMADTELADRYRFASSDNTTAANRPKLDITYTLPIGNRVVRIASPFMPL